MKELLDGFLAYQLEWLLDTNRFKLGMWARQTGKDFTCAAEAVLDCVIFPKRHWLILGCGERQARESLEKAKEFARLLEEGAGFGKVSDLFVGCTAGPQVEDTLKGGYRTGAAHFVRSAARRQPSPTGSAGGRETSHDKDREMDCETQDADRLSAPHSAVPWQPCPIGKLIKRESGTEIRFWNGSRITALPAKAATIRGYSANLILTEFAFHDDPEGIWKAIFPSVSNGLRGGAKKVRIISTPNGMGNCFHELWTGSKIFSKHKITIHDAVAHGLPIDLAALREGLLDAEAWAQEYECEFVDRSSVLLPYELIEGCESAEATETNSVEGLSQSMDATVGNGGELYAGIDFGRKQDLTVCWMLEKLNGELWTREVLVLQRTPTPAQLEILQPRVQRARRICVDYTGAGVGLGDLLAQQFGAARNPQDWSGKVELCTFTAGLKEEIFVKLRAAMERRKLRIPRTTEIREDLHSIHRIVSPTGQISFRASRTDDGHSDRCTALALALRAAESAPAVACATIVGRPSRRFR